MGSVNVYEKDNIEDNPTNCTYCNKQLTKFVEFYPHEAGGYCIFAPRSETDYACEECAFKKCECCGKEQVRFGFTECNKCNKTHCFNNTDMKYEGNPALGNLELCDARHCHPIEENPIEENPIEYDSFLNKSLKYDDWKMCDGTNCCFNKVHIADNENNDDSIKDEDIQKMLEWANESDTNSYDSTEEDSDSDKSTGEYDNNSSEEKPNDVETSEEDINYDIAI